MGRKLHRVLVRVVNDVGTQKLWVEDPDDKEELKKKFQWNYGYWPDDIELIEILETVEEKNVFEHSDIDTGPETGNPNRGT